jgi:acyl dehydratase
MADGYRFPVDLTSILLFASALGETNRIYYDAEYAAGTPLGGVIAPPTFATASAHWDPSYALRGVRRIPAPPARPQGEAPRAAPPSPEAAGGLTRVLHGEQRYEYHRPLRPGMQLRVSQRPGKSWTKQGRRGGRMQFSEHITEYRDESGELVLTGISIGIVTGQAVEAEPG